MLDYLDLEDMNYSRFVQYFIPSSQHNAKHISA